jgi:predicted DNA-binding transcriptional regulator AlpA
MAGDCDSVMGPVRARTKEIGRSRLVQIGLQPLALNAPEAAALCCLSPAQFLKEVAAGNLPRPVRLICKRKVWSLRALESAINGHGGCKTAAHTDPLMREIKSRATRNPA